MGKRKWPSTKSDLQLNTHEKFVLDSSNKTERNEKVTEWLSLDLLGSLLQIFVGALQAWFQGLEQKLRVNTDI